MNQKDLVVGQEYYVKMRFFKVGHHLDQPYCFEAVTGHIERFTQDQPIYTLEQEQPNLPDQPQHPNHELEMLVNVASRLYVTGEFGNHNSCARDAAELIAACKNQLKQQP